MRSFLTITGAIFLMALVSSCQKDSQAPAAKSPALANKFGSTTLSVPLSQSITQGLIVFYPFHGNTNDESGHGYNGELESLILPPTFSNTIPPPTPVANKYGVANDAYLFNGTTDAIELNTPLFDPTKAQTQFSFYVRYKGNGTGALISSGIVGSANPGNPGFALFVQSSGVTFYWNDNFPNAPGAIKDPRLFSFVSSGSTPLAACKDTWVDVVVNFSNSLLTMYINGKKVATTNTELSFFGPAHFASNFHIGYEQETTALSGEFFNSAIDEVILYNRPLTDDEVAYLYAH
jgi:concanavalin A-like lectin/glucanase superfamily protein